MLHVVWNLSLMRQALQVGSRNSSQDKSNAQWEHWIINPLNRIFPFFCFLPSSLIPQPQSISTCGNLPILRTILPSALKIKRQGIKARFLLETPEGNDQQDKPNGKCHCWWKKGKPNEGGRGCHVEGMLARGRTRKRPIPTYVAGSSLDVREQVQVIKN